MRLIPTPKIANMSPHERQAAWAACEAGHEIWAIAAQTMANEMLSFTKWARDPQGGDVIGEWHEAARTLHEAAYVLDNPPEVEEGGIDIDIEAFGAALNSHLETSMTVEAAEVAVAEARENLRRAEAVPHRSNGVVGYSEAYIEARWAGMKAASEALDEACRLRSLARSRAYHAERAAW